MKMPTKFFVVDGADDTKVLLMPCITHGSHVVLGGGVPGQATGALHLLVAEAEQLVDALRAGSSWARLQSAKHLPGYDDVDAELQGSVIVRDGIFGVTLAGGRYVLSWSARGWPVGLAILDDVGRERVASALTELLHGKAAAA